MSTKKKKILPSYLKNTEITTSGGISDDDWQTTPKFEIGVKKGKTSVTGSASKGFSKKDNQNINSTIGFNITKESKKGDSTFTFGGSKTGKDKNLGFTWTKKLSHGGEARVPGSGAAIRGTSFKGIF